MAMDERRPASQTSSRRPSRPTTTPAFVYLIPTFQNPSGRTIPEERRRQIVEIARAAGVTILEDDPYGRIRFEGDGAAVAVRARARVGDLHLLVLQDRLAGPARRLVHPPGGLSRAALTERANSTYITPVQISEAVVYEFIRRGSFEPNLERVNGLLRAPPRRDARRARQAPHRARRWSRPNGGYFVWLELPEGTNAKDVLDRAEGVTAVLGTDFGGGENTLRLAYSYVSPDEIDEGVAAARRRALDDDAGPARAPSGSGRGTRGGWGGGARMRSAALNVGHGRSSASAQSALRWK